MTVSSRQGIISTMVDVEEGPRTVEEQQDAEHLSELLLM